MSLRRLKMTETQLTDVLVEACRLYGYRISHFRPARTEQGWRTPVQGHSGFPDLAIAGHGILLLVELKIGRAKLRPDQEGWRDAIPPEHYRLWTDVNLSSALEELRIRSRPPSASGGPVARSHPE